MKNVGKMKIFLLIAVFVVESSAFCAEVFQWVDNQGRRHYSDRPHQNADILTINPGYSYQKVRKVYDGDTVLLMNGQKVRFLGINTPEVAHRDKEADAGGEEAKKWLIRKLKNKRIRLERDVEKKDKYGRLLAYVITEDGIHLNLELVKEGLATANIYPPNLKYVDEFLAAQDRAENARRGLWAYQQYASQPFTQLQQGNLRGWKRVTGVIKNIKQTRRNIYLQFDDNFSIKIKRWAMDLFPELEQYRGKKVEVRGWLHKSKGKITMLVRHPGSIKIYSQ